MSAVRSARRIELADLVRAHGAAYRQAHRLTRGQHRALRAIGACRTAALGGHTEACDHCGALRIAYNSCRNRHCPKCQTLAKARWVRARQAALLPVEYFHVVFTLPHALNPLAQGNPRVLYGLLFHAARATLAPFGADPRHLGGEVGGIAILHTWGQTLEQHLHLHCVVPGGALAWDGSRWLPAKPGFLFPVRALARVFRGKYLAGLGQAFTGRALRFAGSVAALADPTRFRQFLATLRASDWVVYAKPPFGGPAQVLEYLGRYTHRVAIANDRLLSVAEGVVRFRWRDSAHANHLKSMPSRPQSSSGASSSTSSRPASSGSATSGSSRTAGAATKSGAVGPSSGRRRHPPRPRQNPWPPSSGGSQVWTSPAAPPVMLGISASSPASGPANARRPCWIPHEPLALGHPRCSPCPACCGGPRPSAPQPSRQQATQAPTFPAQCAAGPPSGLPSDSPWQIPSFRLRVQIESP